MQGDLNWQVLAGRQEQIEMKIEVLHQQQQESLVRREELLQDIERANELTQRERVETQRQKEVQADQLAAQVGTTLRNSTNTACE